MPPRKGEIRSWTAEMDADLIRHVEAGKSFSQATTVINGDHGTAFSRNAAIGRSHRLGLKGSAISVQRNKTPRSQKTKKPRAERCNPIVPAFQVEQPEMRCVEVVSRELDILTIGDGECRYPSEAAPFTFCGNPAKGASAYCGPHHALCHTYTPAPRRPDAQRTGAKRSSFFLNFEAA